MFNLNAMPIYCTYCFSIRCFKGYCLLFIKSTFKLHSNEEGLIIVPSFLKQVWFKNDTRIIILLNSRIISLNKMDEQKHLQSSGMFARYVDVGKGSLEKIQKAWKKEKQVILIILAVVFGVTLGLLSNEQIQNTSEPARSHILLFLGFPGEIFMRMMKLLILPLIVTSLIVGLAELDRKSSGILRRRALLYYLSTTALAVALGITLVMAIQPGNQVEQLEISKTKRIKARTMDTVLDLVRNMFPENLVQACFPKDANHFCSCESQCKKRKCSHWY